jgi:integrase
MFRSWTMAACDVEGAYCFGWRSGGLKRMQVWQANRFDCTLTLTAEQSKNGEEIRVPILKSDLLYRLLAACVSGKERTDYVFSRENPKNPIKDFRQSWKLACTAAGFPELLFHDLRRTAVSNMELTGYHAVSQ